MVDTAGWPKIGLLNRDFGSILSVFPRKKSKTQSSLKFLQSGPQKFSKPDFLGLAPIRRVLIFGAGGIGHNVGAAMVIDSCLSYQSYALIPFPDLSSESEGRTNTWAAAFGGAPADWWTFRRESSKRGLKLSNLALEHMRRRQKSKRN